MLFTGNISGEATILIGNNSGEAMRHQPLESGDYLMKFRMSPISYRTASLPALTLFVAALYAPVTSVSFKHPEHTEVLRGYFIAASGWLGPLSLSVAWYANIPFVRCAYQLAQGRAPSETWAWAGLFLALSTFIPQVAWDSDGFSHFAFLYGLAVWLWLASFVVVLVAVYLPPGPPSRTTRSAR